MHTVLNLYAGLGGNRKHWDANITAKACPKPQTGVAQDHALAVGVQDAYRILSDPVEPSLHAAHPRQEFPIQMPEMADDHEPPGVQAKASKHAMVLQMCTACDRSVGT